MKILLTLDSGLTIPGGVQTYVRGLDDALTSRGHQVTLLVAGKIPREDRKRKIVSLGVVKELSLATSASLPLILVNPLRVFRFLESERFDLIHIPGHGGLLSWWVVLLARAPVVATFLSGNESDSSQAKLKLVRPLAGILNRQLKAKIAISQTARDFAKILFPGEYRVIPAGIYLQRFSASPQGSAEQPGRALLNIDGRGKNGKVVILFVGRLDPRKGIMDLLEAMRRLKEKRRSGRCRFGLIVVGDGPERGRAQRFVKKHRLARVVQLVGRASDEELPGYYRRADIYCSPAKREESFGIVLLEAMAAGLPVVAYGNCGYREVLTGKLAKLLIRPGDIDGLADKLEQLIGDDKLRQRFGDLSRKYAKNFDWPKVVIRIEQVYQAVLAPDRGELGSCLLVL